MINSEPTSNGLLQPIKHWLENPHVSEILLNKPGEIFVEENNALTRHTVTEFTVRTLDRLFQLIANENSQELNIRKPLLSGSLLNGSRVQIVLPPTAKYHAFSIRKKVLKNFSLDDYQQAHFFNEAIQFDINENEASFMSQGDQQLLHLYQGKKWGQFIRQAILQKKNIVVSGGTSSGKTTFLNACLREIPLEERIILLEDTREVEIPHDNKVQLLASKGEQGLAKVSLQDLVQCCLRLRPDRIICGEIRGKEILDFVSACSTGHEGSMTTIHANNPKIAFMRMCQMYKLNNLPSMGDVDIMRELNAVIDIIIQVNKTTHGRCIQSIYYKMSTK